MISIVNWDRGQWGWPMMTGEDWKRNPQVGEKILGVAREEVFVHPFQLFQQQPQPVKRYLCPFQQFQQQSYQWTFILQGIAIGDSFLKILSHVTKVGFIIGDISIWIIFAKKWKQLLRWVERELGTRQCLILDWITSLDQRYPLLSWQPCNDCHQLSNVSSL